MRSALARWLDPHMHEVLRGAMTAFPLRALGAGIGFALNVVLGRLLGAEDVGLYFLALTVATIASALGTLGLGNVMLRHVAADAARDDWAALRAIAITGMRASLVCAVALTVLLAVAAPWIAGSILEKPELATPLQWMALTIVPQTQLRLHAQLLRGLKKIALSQTLRNIDVPLMTMVFIAILGGTFGVTGAVWSFALASLITAVLASWAWRRALGPAGSGADSASGASVGLRDLLRSGFPILQSNLMNLLLNPMTTLLLGAMGSTAGVAIFAIAFRTAMLTRFSLIAVNAIAAPKFAALHGTADSKALATTARRSTFLITLAASPLLVVFVVFPGWTMSLFGKEFAAGAEVLMILALGQFFAAICGSVGYLLMMSGNEKLLRNNTVIAGVACLALNLLLIPDHGAVGAAFAVSAAIALRSLLGSIQVYRRLGILPFFIPAPAEVPNDP